MLGQRPPSLLLHQSTVRDALGCSSAHSLPVPSDQGGASNEGAVGVQEERDVKAPEGYQGQSEETKGHDPWCDGFSCCPFSFNVPSF
jgi:hypothetical protein